ncbi:MAG: ATP-binding cassette domain-containing protein [Propionibacteriaceae bacterium]|nr:ATP-binding cassette domain-containing protein [Propionibacteriaceae bacterium]
MSFLEVRNIVKYFDKQPALNNVSIEIGTGELVCILGPSGCGKTTLLRIIAGLENPDSGQVLIDGKDVTNLPPAKRSYGIVFQSYALFPNMTVMGNILFGLREKKGLTKTQRFQQACKSLKLVDLYEHRDKYPRQLSGGMQQRTALARAIALTPAFLLLDEPLSALDAKVRVKLRSEIRDIQRRLQVTTVMVTHDQEEALTMADRIVVMNNAVIEQVGTPKEIYDKPATPFVASFIGTMNFFRNSNELIGIRPENIEITNEPSSSEVAANIQTLEFRGPLTRVYSTISESEGQTSEICLDIPTGTAKQLCLEENGTLYLRMSKEHQITYETTAA